LGLTFNSQLIFV